MSFGKSYVQIYIFGETKQHFEMKNNSIKIILNQVKQNIQKNFEKKKYYIQINFFNQQQKNLVTQLQF
jgi:hypothetical protein